MTPFTKRLLLFCCAVSSFILFYFSIAQARPPRRGGTAIFVTSTQSLLINIAIGLFAIIAIVALVYVIRTRKKPDDDLYRLGPDSPPSRTRKTIPRRAKPAAETRDPFVEPVKEEKNTERPVQDLVVTEKTREQINNMLQSITAIRLPEKPVEAERTEELEGSGIVHALANTLVSEPSTEESEIGKLSKMSIDGSLIFDEADLVEAADESEKAKK